MASTVKSLEADHGKAQVSHTRALKKMEKILDNRAPNIRAVKTALETLEYEFDNLQDRHVAFVLKSNSTLNNPQHAIWMSSWTEEHEAAAERANVVLGRLELVEGESVPVDDTVPRLEEKQEQFDMAEIRIVAALGQLDIEANKELKLSQYEVLVGTASELKNEISVVVPAVCTEIRSLTVDNTERGAAKAKHTDFIKSNLAKVEQILMKIHGKKPEAAVGAAAPAGPVGQVPQGQAHQGARGGVARPKLQPIANPKWDGKSMSFLRFKSKYDAIIAGVYDMETELEILEQALPPHVKSQLSMLKKTPAQIWEQLDKLYKDPKLVLKETMAELYSLDAKALGDKFMPRLSVTLDDAEALLTEEGHLNHLNHPREVMALEDMLPLKEAEEFLRRNPTYSGGDYEVFKKYVDERKLEVEALARFGSKTRMDKPLGKPPQA